MTVEPAEFLDLLRPADVLLFDSMRPVSHIIKLAENAPVNHAALFAGGGDYYHASTHKPGESAVARMSLETRLATGYHRTVTSLRHKRVLDGVVDPADVVDQARQIEEAGPAYALVDLISLVVPTFWRSYHGYFDGSRPADPAIVELFDVLTKGLIADIEGAASPPTPTPHAEGRNPMTLTCSELVYLCFERTSPGCFTIRDPLTRWTEQVTKPIPDSYARAAANAEDLLAQYPPLPPRPDAAGGLHLTGNDMISLLRRSIRSISGIAAANLAAHKYDGCSIQPGDPLSDCVTPGDLWASPSLTTTAVLHLPAPGSQSP